MGIVRKIVNGNRWVENIPTGGDAPSVDVLDAYLAAWVADIRSVPFRTTTSTAPEATR